MDTSNILTEFLDRLAERAIKQIKEEGSLGQENAIPFLIKDQYTKIASIESNVGKIQNHFATVESVQNLENKMMDFRQEVIENINRVEKQIGDLQKYMAIGFTIISILIGVASYLK